MNKAKRWLLILPSLLFAFFDLGVVIHDRPLYKYGWLSYSSLVTDSGGIRPDRMLSASPLLVTISGFFLLLLCMSCKRRGAWVILFVYTGFIILMTLLYREPGGHMANTNPFAGIQRFMAGPEPRQELLNNIWLFIPFGVLLGKIFRTPWVILVPFAFSFGIESVQYIFGVGYADAADVLHNTLGGALGVLGGIGTARGKK